MKTVRAGPAALSAGGCAVGESQTRGGECAPLLASLPRPRSIFECFATVPDDRVPHKRDSPVPIE